LQDTLERQVDTAPDVATNVMTSSDLSVLTVESLEKHLAETVRREVAKVAAQTLTAQVPTVDTTARLTTSGIPAGPNFSAMSTPVSIPSAMSRPDVSPPYALTAQATPSVVRPAETTTTASVISAQRTLQAKQTERTMTQTGDSECRSAGSSGQAESRPGRSSWFVAAGAASRQGRVPMVLADRRGLLVDLLGPNRDFWGSVQHRWRLFL